MAQDLGILPLGYPVPLQKKPESTTVPSVQSVVVSHPHVPNQCDPVSKEDIMKEFPTTFGGQIHTMPGERFKIVLVNGV